MKRGILILALIFMLMPVVFSQETTPTYVWSPRDNLCQILDLPESSYGFMVVPSCETEWSLESFLTPDSLGPLCQTLSDNSCPPCVGQSDCPTCPTCPTCEAINKNSCKEYCPSSEGTSAIAPSLDTNEPGLVQTYLGSYIPLDVLFLLLFIIIVVSIFKLVDFRNEWKLATDAYIKTASNFILLREKYDKLLRVKEPLVKPEEITKKP